MNPDTTVERVAWHAADALRLDLLNRASGHSADAGDSASAAISYLRAMIEDAAKEQGLLATPWAELQRTPADDRALDAFSHALEEVLRQDHALAQRLENWIGQNAPPSRAEYGSDEGEVLEGMPGGEEAAPPPSNPVQAWLNAELEDADPSQPLAIGDTYTLAFSLDQAAKHTFIADGAPFKFLFPPETDEVILTVQLDSENFDVLERSRPLRFRRPGVAQGKARFDIIPRRNGRHQLVATVHHAGNFLQQLTVTIDVGVAADHPLETSSLGRPIADAAVLQPRDIGLAIEPAPGGGYNCTAWGATAARVHLPIQEQELASAIDQVRRTLLDVVGKQKFRTQLDIPPEDREAALRLLAREGFRLYQKIFYHPAGGADARRLGDWLRQQTTGTDEVLKIQLVTRNFPVPWGLLYIDDGWKADAIDWQRFLGMSHVIEQIPLQTTLSTLNGVIDSGSAGLSVSVNFNESIDKQMHADFVARQVSYWGTAVDFEPPVNVVSRTKREELVNALKDGATPDQILYIYCHAVAAGLVADGPDASYMVLSGDERVTLGDLNLEAPTSVQLVGNPLVFINACESAELSPLFYDGFVPYFMAKGARGVIGTECKTPALFAAEWARTFFDRFLDGGSLGQVFLGMRREFFEQHGNPLGLIYGVHCDGDTRVQPAMSRTST
ncbi:CHAT domain-containing protein [Pseudarthrobacter sp. NS4]|uniref:CHAT domain-containing protein n=1 Tax=Pseudarthrobacter sp. NS4 TaxID=2973976 RepID=UPI0021634D10|nr:CHAT domain-containing protein [Pseudarthrobacter sp. NS4]